MVRQKTTPLVPVFRVGGGESLVQWGGNEAGRTLSPWGVSPNIRTEGTRAKKRARRGSGQQGNYSPVSQQRGELAVDSIGFSDLSRNAPGMPRQPAANRISIRPIGLDREREDIATPTKGGGSIINTAFEPAQQQDVAEVVEVDGEHLRAACIKSKMSGSCKIYGWSVEDENGARLYKFRDPRIKLQAIGLWHRYCDVEALFQHTQEPHQKIMEGIAGICILLSSKLFDTKDHALNVRYLHGSLEHQEEGGVGFKEPKDLDDLEIEFLEFIEYRIDRDRLCLVFEESHELLYSIKDYVGASNYGSILWNRLVDSFFIVSCNARHREQIEAVPDPLLSSAFVAAAYGLTPNPSNDKVSFPSALIYDLCNNPPLNGQWDCKDLEMVTNLILDMVLETMPGANYDLTPLTEST